MKSKLAIIIVFTFLLGFTPVSVIFAQTSTLPVDTTALIRQLQALVLSLQTQIQELRAKLETTRGEIETVKTEIKELKLTRSLQRGVTGDDVRELQEFLSTQYPDLYPTKQITGYFGSATEIAIKKLQEQQGIESIGIVGPKTIAKLKELVTSSFTKTSEDKKGAGKSDKIPPGLLRALELQSTTTQATTTLSGKLTICHIPPGSSTNKQTIEIDQSALPAHFAHGDTAGACITIPVTSPPSTATTTPPVPQSSTSTTTIATSTAPAPSPGVTPPPTTTQPPSTGTSTTTITTTPPPSPTPSPPLPPSPPAIPIAHTCGQPVNVPQDISSIQAALNAACSGDTVYVGAGTYYENITIPKSSLTLKGSLGTTAETVIIDGGGIGNVVFATGIQNFTIDGFTIQNSRQSNSCLISEPSPCSAGVHLINPPNGNVGTTIMRNLIVKNNFFGVWIQGILAGNITFERNVIVDNQDTAVHMGVCGSSSAVITNNTIANNKGYYTYLDSCLLGNRTLRNNIIVKNSGFGVYLYPNSQRTILYNNGWSNTLGTYATLTSSIGGLSVDPKFVSSSDYHLQSSSPMINAGDLALTDPDGSRSDMGAYYFSGSTPPSPSPTPIPSTLATTTATGTLSISKSDTVSAGNVSIDTNVDLGAFSFQAQTESIEISSLRLKFVIPAAEDGTQIDAVTIIDQNGTIVAGSVDVGTDETATLANIWTVPVGAQTYKIKGRLTTDFEDGDTVAVSLTPNTHITAKGVTSGTGITASPSSSVLTNTLTVHRSVNTSAPSSSSTTASTTGMMEKINAFAAMLQSVKTLLQMLQSIAK